MKLRKNDKVVMLCLKNVYGIDFHAVFGELLGMRKGMTFNVAKIKVSTAVYLRGSLDMEGKEMELSTDVFTLRPDNKETRALLKSMRAQALDLEKTALAFKAYGKTKLTN